MNTIGPNLEHKFRCRTNKAKSECIFKCLGADAGDDGTWGEMNILYVWVCVSKHISGSVMKLACECECVNESIDENVQFIVRDRYHMLVVSRETQKLNANICVKCYEENGGKNWIRSQAGGERWGHGGNCWFINKQKPYLHEHIYIEKGANTTKWMNECTNGTNVKSVDDDDDGDDDDDIDEKRTKTASASVNKC